MDDDLHFKLQLLMDFSNSFWSQPWELGSYQPFNPFGSQTPPPSAPEPFEPKVFQDHPTFSLQFPNPFEPNSLNHVLATPSSTDHHAPAENNAPFSSHQALNQDSNMSTTFNHMSCCDHHHHHHHDGALVDGNKNQEKDGAGSVFECRICLGMAKQPVVTPCGHLFCWPCLSLWLYKPSNECPACRCVILEHEIPFLGVATNKNLITLMHHQGQGVKPVLLQDSLRRRILCF